jgi:hypothetical protein
VGAAEEPVGARVGGVVGREALELEAREGAPAASSWN